MSAIKAGESAQSVPKNVTPEPKVWLGYLSDNLLDAISLANVRLAEIRGLPGYEKEAFDEEEVALENLLTWIEKLKLRIAVSLHTCK